MTGVLISFLASVVSNSSLGTVTFDDRSLASENVVSLSHEKLIVVPCIATSIDNRGIENKSST
jgi:hypothetical protein